LNEKLIKPTFIIDYPKDVSPLSKAKENNKDIAERFELYIGGMEIANGFNELNDPIEQKMRFEEQVKIMKIRMLITIISEPLNMVCHQQLAKD